MTKPRKLEMLKIPEDQRVPMPVREAKVPAQVEVNADLMEAVEAEAKKRKLKKRQVVEWGLKQWLVMNNPKAAHRLGYVDEEDPR